MKRLIDADNFRRFVHEQLEFGKPYTDDEILEMIDEQPTAYSVETVVAELEKQAKQYHRRAEEHKGYDAYNNLFEGKALSYEHAISIVRGKE